jgi:pimeloyl-ACP methyl ester carboxylesterase
MEAEAPTYEGDAQKTGASASTPVNGNTARVGEGRKDPVDLYYELHGRGPHKVLLVMGTCTTKPRTPPPPVHPYLTPIFTLIFRRFCHVMQGLDAQRTPSAQPNGNSPGPTSLTQTLVGVGQQVKELVAEHGDEFEVCIFDNRGCGRSSCPDSKFRFALLVHARSCPSPLLLTCHHFALANTSTSVMAGDALDLLDHLKWDRVLTLPRHPLRHQFVTP